MLALWSNLQVCYLSLILSLSYQQSKRTRRSLQIHQVLFLQIQQMKRGLYSAVWLKRRLLFHCFGSMLSNEQRSTCSKCRLHVSPVSVWKSKEMRVQPRCCLSTKANRISSKTKEKVQNDTNQSISEALRWLSSFFAAVIFAASESTWTQSISSNDQRIACRLDCLLNAFRKRKWVQMKCWRSCAYVMQDKVQSLPRAWLFLPPYWPFQNHIGLRWLPWAPPHSILSTPKWVQQRGEMQKLVSWCRTLNSNQTQ